MAFAAGAILAVAVLALGATGGPPVARHAQPAPPETGRVPTPGPTDEPAVAMIRWDRARDPGRVLGGPLSQTVRAVTLHGDRLVAIGEANRGEPGAQWPFAVSWVSEDGHDWQGSEIAAGLAPRDTASVHDVASTGEVVLAVGGVCCAAEEVAAMWRSVDGLSWERVPLPDWMRALNVRSVAGAAAGFVAVGQSAHGKAVIAVSTDGSDWQAVDRAKAGLGKGSAASVAASDRGWIAVGHQGDDPTWDGAVWTSPDLTSWERVAADDSGLAADDEVELDRVVPFGGGVLATGGKGSHEDRIACEKLGLDVVGLPDAALAYSCGWLEPAMWWSADGTQWRERAIPEGEGAPFYFDAIVPAEDGLIGIGPRRGIAHPEGDTIALWRSDDGSAWHAIGPVPAVAIGTTVVDATVIDGTIVLVGESWLPDQQDGGDGAVWIGTGLR